jgi:hypothetical protein
MPTFTIKTWLRIYVQLTDLISTPGDVCGGPCQYASVTFDDNTRSHDATPYVTHPMDRRTKGGDDAKKTLLRLHYPCRDGRVFQTFVGSTEKRRAMPA